MRISAVNMDKNLKVGIVGGGIMGICLGYYLTRQGIHVEIFEASPDLGGLAGPMILPDGTPIDRFYHAILSSDAHLRGLAQEVGIQDQLRFKGTRMGFFHKGKIFPMNNMIDFLRFPPLGWIDRFRLGITVVAAQLVRDWKKLESISVQDWLLRFSGRNTYENIWRPMLKAKFDSGFDKTPATWIWSRLVRIKSARSGASQKEEAGHLVGGYATLMKALAQYIQANGGKIHLSTPVQEVVVRDGEAKALRLASGEISFDAVAVTMQTPIFQRLVPSASQEYQDFLKKTDYIGIVCPLLVLDRPLTDYWTLNITDDRIPFTGVIETTSFIDPSFVGGHHLVYLPKYTAAGSSWFKMTDEEIRSQWLNYLKLMFPNFDEKSIRYFLVHRERYVEPLHYLNLTDLIPAIKTPVKNLYLATTSQIYPALTNGESVSKHAAEAAQVMMSDFQTQ